MVIGAKYFDDVYFDNKIYSKIGGICLQEFNKLELEFLYFLNYKLYVKPLHFL